MADLRELRHRRTANVVTDVSASASKSATSLASGRAVCIEETTSRIARVVAAAPFSSAIMPAWSVPLMTRCTLSVDLLREKGWSWLLDTERVHETIGCAIVDTAHVLVTDALAKGDLDLAREVAEAACEAAPYDDICRLDLVKVAAAEGHEEVADQMLNDNVFNRTDDYLPPVDIPKRTGDVVAKEGWGNTKRRLSASNHRCCR